MILNRMRSRFLVHRKDEGFLFVNVKKIVVMVILLLKTVFKISLLNDLRVKPIETDIGFPETQFLWKKMAGECSNS